jgi:hypothetical protein
MNSIFFPLLLVARNIECFFWQNTAQTQTLAYTHANSPCKYTGNPTLWALSRDWASRSSRLMKSRKASHCWQACRLFTERIALVKSSLNPEKCEPHAESGTRTQVDKFHHKQPYQMSYAQFASTGNTTGKHDKPDFQLGIKVSNISPGWSDRD